MAERRQRINRLCNRVGLALAVPLIAFGGYFYLQARSIADFDDRAEMVGAALAFPFAGAVVYLVCRVAGWVWAELVD
jgi:hypothetical protein